MGNTATIYGKGAVAPKLHAAAAAAASESPLSPTAAVQQRSRRALFANPDTCASVFDFLGVWELQAVAAVGILAHEELWEAAAKRAWPLLTREPRPPRGWRHFAVRRALAQRGPRKQQHQPPIPQAAGASDGYTVGPASNGVVMQLQQPQQVQPLRPDEVRFLVDVRFRGKPALSATGELLQRSDRLRDGDKLLASVAADGEVEVVETFKEPGDATEAAMRHRDWTVEVVAMRVASVAAAAAAATTGFIGGGGSSSGADKTVGRESGGMNETATEGGGGGEEENGDQQAMHIPVGAMFPLMAKAPNLIDDTQLDGIIDWDDLKLLYAKAVIEYYDIDDDDDDDDDGDYDEDNSDETEQQPQSIAEGAPGESNDGSWSRMGARKGQGKNRRRRQRPGRTVASFAVQCDSPALPFPFGPFARDVSVHCRAVVSLRLRLLRQRLQQQPQKKQPAAQNSPLNDRLDPKQQQQQPQKRRQRRERGVEDMMRAGAENKNDEEAEDEGTGPWRLQLEVDDVRVDFPVQHHYPAEEEQGQLMAGVRAIATGAPAARRDGLLRVGAAARDDGAADAVDAAMEVAVLQLNRCYDNLMAKRTNRIGAARCLALDETLAMTSQMVDHWR